MGITRYVLDSGIASFNVDKRRGVFERAEQEVAKGNLIGICTPILGELASGLERSASREVNFKKLNVALDGWKLWPFDEQAAYEYGKLHARLKRIGRPMQTIDVQTAAVAISLRNCVVVTMDSDFSAIDEVDIENWAS